MASFPNRRALLGLSIALLSATGAARAAEAEAENARPAQDLAIEEVVVTARQYNAAAQLTDERIVDDAVSDLLGSEAISRVGDSNVAVALQRVPGLSLVNGQFIYVRGLGERYSQTTVNGASVPSVDLSRNVVPLDLFPSFIVDSLSVQKSYSADRQASFGGGAIDIRTKRIPDGFVGGLQLGSAINSANDGEVLTYAGGGEDNQGQDDGTRALSPRLQEALDQYQGNVSVQNILSRLRGTTQPDATLADAQAINRLLGTYLYRDLSVLEKDTPFDRNIRGYLGNSMLLSDDLEIGGLAAGGYTNQWRETTRLGRNFLFPEEETDERLQATQQVNMTGNASLGLRYLEEHEVSATAIYLRNTEDDTYQRTFFNENRRRSSGLGFGEVGFRFEERDVLIMQYEGNHRVGAATRSELKDRFGSLLPASLFDLVPEDLEFNWFISDSKAETSIPNEVTISQQGPTNDFFQLVDPQVVQATQAANYRFTELDDDVLNHGWELKAPFYFDRIYFEVSGGYNHRRQDRVYEQSQFNLGSLSVANLETLRGPLGGVFSTRNINDTANDFIFARAGANNQSYLAGTMTDAYFGQVDMTFAETWRLAAGLRWEKYRQYGLDFDPFGYSPATPIISTDPEVLANAVFQDDDLYPSLSLTYMRPFWADTFQLRATYAETVVRPDLREITDASYIDPLTEDLVFGNSGVTPATLTNYDLRAEWFWNSGDSLTVSLFYKDIENPIEFFETTASDTTVAREIVNAASAEVYGVEFEVLKDLGSVANFLSPFFLQGNITLQDSEIVAGGRADAPTNDTRELTNASPWIVNLIVGYDSMDAKHSATVAYNAFDDRLFVAGRNGAPDGFEQTRHSINATYFFYPTDSLTVQLKASNLLDDPISIEREGVETLNEKIGRTFSLSVQWELY
jgi:TonB-dependent receptor